MPTTNEECRCCKLIGILSEVETMIGELSPIDTLVGEIYIPEGISYDVYTGEYTVIPDTFDQIILDTEQKLMLGDVTVEPVPYYETTNPAGGFTVYIGGD